MSREPLMLSDTAMVLLREYQHLYEGEVGRLRNRNTDSQYIAQYASTAPDLSHVVTEFVRELEALWLSADLVPRRSLDWHFVLNDDLAAQIEKVFELLPNHRVPWLGEYTDYLHLNLFVAAVAQAYQEALVP